MAINNLSRELSGILDTYGYETSILPAKRVSIDLRYYRHVLRDLEFHFKEYEVLSGKKHNLKNKAIEFYAGMWYLKKEGYLK